MLIRKATKEDIPRLIEIKPVLSEERINDRLKIQLEGSADFLVMEVNGKIISFVYLKYLGKETHPEYPEIEDLFTKDNERNKGYGSTLILECEKLVKQKGFNKIGLSVNPNLNASAMKLYEGLGFCDLGEGKYLDGVYNGVEDWCVDMEKKL